MTSVIRMFNAASTPVNVIINNGTQFQIPAADSTSWQPGTPTTQPSFTGSMPSQGSFGYGANSCAITPTTSGGTATATVSIPTNLNPSDAIQLYVFYQDTNSVSWVLLDNGRAVAGNLAGF